MMREMEGPEVLSGGVTETLRRDVSRRVRDIKRQREISEFCCLPQ